MRSVLLIILVTITIPASAQWWRIDLKLKKKELPHPELIEPAKDHSRARLPGPAVSYPQISLVQFSRSDYSYEAEESIVIKQAQHNMRYNTYTDASYNFSDLAHLYIQQNRFSEAKWYLLQSNLISREQNDYKHTISNLIDLATIKVNIGEYLLAQTDLAEAHDLAASRGLNEYLPEIENMMLYMKQNKVQSLTPILRYAEAPQKAQ